MKYTIHPLALVSILVLILFFGVLAVAIITPSVILDFLKSITPTTDEQLRNMYILLAIAGAVIMFFILRHKKPYKFKKRKTKNRA